MESLPTKVKLFESRILENKDCVFCNENPETLPHLFKDCNDIRALYFEVLGKRTDSIRWNNGMDIVSYLLHANNSRNGLNLVIRWLTWLIVFGNVEKSFQR